jgi:hypothetical protein
LFPGALFRGQFKSLSDYRQVKTRHSWIEIIVVYGIPAAALVSMWITNSSIRNPEAILAGVSLLAGSLLAAFAQLSAWRDRLQDRAEKFRATESIHRDALDETATHLLASSYASALTAGLLILGMNFSVNPDSSIFGIFAWLAAATGTYVFIVFLIALPRLYKNYVMINKVRHELNGTFH